MAKRRRLFGSGGDGVSVTTGAAPAEDESDPTPEAAEEEVPAFCEKCQAPALKDPRGMHECARCRSTALSGAKAKARDYFNSRRPGGSREAKE